MGVCRSEDFPLTILVIFMNHFSYLIHNCLKEKVHSCVDPSDPIRGTAPARLAS